MLVPVEQPSEERAIRTAKELARGHAGVIAESREGNPALGEYVFQTGDVPDME